MRALLPAQPSASPLRALLGAAALVLAGCAEGDGGERPAGQRAARGGEQPWLVEVTDRMGLDFVCETGPIEGWPLARIMGGGVALFDADGDGALDLYLVNGSEHLAGGGGVPGAARNRFYLQRDGRFVDDTERSGLGDDGYGMGVAIGDVDNDGALDVYVTNYGPDRLYRNRGDGTFEDVTRAAGISVGGWSCSATFVDYDGDGWLDLFVTRYVEDIPEKECTNTHGRRDFCSPRAFQPAYDVLLRNQGGGVFRDVSSEAGIDSVAGPGLGVIAEDFDGDGLVDLFVANDGRPNFLWRNRGDGTFEEAAYALGVALNAHGASEASMGVLAEDLDGNLEVDLFMTHLREESNTLYANLGGGRGFQDQTAVLGLAAPSLPFTGFGTAAIDLELDGRLDILIANGRVQHGPVLPGALPGGPWAAYAEPNQVFTRRDERFELLEGPARSFAGAPEISRGLALGDIDGDGRPDVVVTNLRGPARVYLCDAPRRGRWLAVRAFDPELGREALGARVVVTAGDRAFARTIRRGGSYLSSSDATAHFGLGDVAAVEHVEVRWPDGARERFPGGPADLLRVLVRGEGELE